MTRTNFTSCLYCKSRNPTSEKNCISCGAPIEKKALKVRPEKVQTSPAKSKTPEKELQRVGEKAEEAFFTVANAYAIAWRTVGEAISIAVSAFIIGAAGGVIEMRLLGILGAIFLGITVGLTRKNFYSVLISAPLGAFIGLGIGAVLLILGLSWGLPASVTFFSILGAVLGGKSRANFKYQHWWEKARPLLGGIGGLLFGFFGILIGIALQKTISFF